MLLPHHLPLALPQQQLRQRHRGHRARRDLRAICARSARDLGAISASPYYRRAVGRVLDCEGDRVGRLVRRRRAAGVHLHPFSKLHRALCALHLGGARVSALLSSRTGPIGTIRERPRGRGRLSAPRVTRAPPTRFTPTCHVLEMRSSDRRTCYATLHPSAVSRPRVTPLSLSRHCGDGALAAAAMPGGQAMAVRIRRHADPELTDRLTTVPGPNPARDAGGGSSRGRRHRRHEARS